MTWLLIEIASYIMEKMEPQYIQRQLINCTSKSNQADSLQGQKYRKKMQTSHFWDLENQLMLRNMKKKLSSFCKNSVSMIKIWEYETTVKLRSIPFHVNVEHFPAEF